MQLTAASSLLVVIRTYFKGTLMKVNPFAHVTLANDFNYPAPEVPAIVKDEAGQEYPGGILLRAALDDDLEVIVDAWDFSENPLYSDLLEVGWRPEGAAFITVNSEEFWPPIDPGAKVITVPRDRLTQGRFHLSYRITRTNNTTPSVDKLVTVDRAPPNEGQRLTAAIFPDELVGIITDEYLTQHGEVQLRVPSYLGMVEFDEAVFYWSEFDPLPDGHPVAGEHRFSKEEIDNRRLFLAMGEADIRASGGGTRYFYYRLYDLAGNESAVSYASPIQVNLVPAPAKLPPPRIPLSIRGLIDREHAREGAAEQRGVTVEIDAYDNAEASHFIEVDWGGQRLSEFPVDPAAFPLSAYVPWPALVANGLGPDAVSVSYRVRYGANYSAPSPVATAPFDFTIAGQDHAMAPALLNTDLAKLEVRGAVSDLPNELTAQDEGENARVLLPLFDDPLPGEYLEIFWGTVVEPADRYDVKPGDVGGQLLELSVPWRIIEQDKNNTALPVFYVTDNGVNQQLAPTTAVRVVVEPITGLPAPDIPQADTSGYLNCSTMPPIWEGVTIRVEGNDNFAEGDTVEVAWLGHEDLGGLRPIPSTAFSASRFLSKDEAENGFEVTVLPYDVHIEPMEKEASAIISYELTKLAGGYGKSQRALFYIDRTLPSGEICKPGYKCATKNRTFYRVLARAARRLMGLLSGHSKMNRG
ncbi:hypothetical protein HG549_07305 [Pseudomonas sp. SK]|uniref:hypothetical protein n=1 Tax=Pseudomonas sp. SK TaxID=2729423 RepID=UPI00146335A6|nr:hypothetical protein [Pseudomonas sp. SK]QJQ19760.1 hypothetical protein HG549_07305 [Pseudomonas sp. SK]